MRDYEVIGRWESRLLDPDYGMSEAEYPCSECGNEAGYEINGEWFCENCIDQFRAVKGDDNHCCMCGDEVEGYFLVNGEILCDKCFEDMYRR